MNKLSHLSNSQIDLLLEALNDSVVQLDKNTNFLKSGEWHTDKDVVIYKISAKLKQIQNLMVTLT